MRPLALVLAFLLAPTLWAADFIVPDQRIEGADAVIPLGEMVDLSISTLKNKPEYLTEVSYTWKVWNNSTGEELRVRTYKDGIFFGAGIKPRRLRVAVAATYLYLVKDGDKVTEVAVKTSLLTALVKIGDEEPGPEPGPGPGPNPGPGPGPDLPDGRYGLAKLAYQAALKVDAGIRKKGAAALAASFRNMASVIVAGGVKSDEEALKKTREANNAALDKLSIDRKAWDGLAIALQERLYELYKNKELKALADYATAFEEVARGLEGVK